MTANKFSGVYMWPCTYGDVYFDMHGYKMHDV